MTARFSITPARAVEDLTLKPAAFKVLVCLGVYADREGYCYPAQGTLAKKLHVSRQAVNRQIRILLQLGYLKIIHRNHPSGAALSCLYQIQFEDAIDPAAAVVEVKENREDPINFLPRSSSTIDCAISNGQVPSSPRIPEPGRSAIHYTATSRPCNPSEPLEITGVSDLATPILSADEPPAISTPDIPGVSQRSQLTSQIRSREDRILSSDPSSSSLKFTGIPSARNQEPFLALYFAITRRLPPEREREKITFAMHALQDHFADDSSLHSFLAPIWDRWCQARRADGTHYSRSNSAWLTDWAFEALDQDLSYGGSDAVISCDPERYQAAAEPLPERRA